MDILSINMDPLVYTVIKILFLCTTVVMFLIAYFHASEAKKAEKRLKLQLPGFVRTGLSFHMFAAFFLFVTVLVSLLLKL